MSDIRNKKRPNTSMHHPSNEDPKLKKTKLSLSFASALNDPNNTLESGQIMARAWETMNESERERFASYRRGVLPSDAIERYVSHRLLQNGLNLHYKGMNNSGGLKSDTMRAKKERLVVSEWEDLARRNFCHNGNDHKTSSSTLLPPTPPLEWLVAPGTSGEIVSIVSSLAKLYAQRLIKECLVLKKWKKQEEEYNTYEDDSERKTQETNQMQHSNESKPILPEELKDAHRHSVLDGSIPGFFLGQYNGGINADNTNPSHNRRKYRRGIFSHATKTRLMDNAASLEAALAAQELYDKKLNDFQLEYESKLKEDTKEDEKEHLEDTSTQIINIKEDNVPNYPAEDTPEQNSDTIMMIS